jgi:DNA modification methylase
MENFDLFGNPIVKNNNLKEMFGENPFSILDTKSGLWQARKRNWIKLGIKSEIGRNAKTYHTQKWASDKGRTMQSDTSIFDPVLCELMYKWFCPSGGAILDPFAGGSVRGIVANYLGFHYTGIDIRHEQVDSNREQALDILKVDNQPQWYVGDSNKVLDGITTEFDLVFSCPPYADLEVYSDLEGDISNMKYDDFLEAYERIIKKSCERLKKGGFAIFVVGEVRDKNGNYYGFVPDTHSCFKKAGLHFYNEAILSTPIGTAMFRASGNMRSKKLVKVHQNILIFKKP